jgi:predicted Zn-dependent peptidase
MTNSKKTLESIKTLLEELFSEIKNSPSIEPSKQTELRTKIDALLNNDANSEISLTGLEQLETEKQALATTQTALTELKQSLEAVKNATTNLSLSFHSIGP